MGALVTPSSSLFRSLTEINALPPDVLVPSFVLFAKVELTKALPFLEKAQAKEPKDPDALRALYQVYQQLKMNEKANATYEKLEALEK